MSGSISFNEIRQVAQCFWNFVRPIRCSGKSPCSVNCGESERRIDLFSRREFFGIDNGDTIVPISEQSSETFTMQTPSLSMHIFPGEHCYCWPLVDAAFVLRGPFDPHRGSQRVIFRKGFGFARTWLSRVVDLTEYALSFAGKPVRKGGSLFGNFQLD